MHVLLNLPATGVAQANGKNLKRYYDHCPEDYARYRAKTSIILPMVGYEHVPLLLKRTLLLDFERYEYRPRKKGWPGRIGVRSGCVNRQGRMGLNQG